MQNRTKFSRANKLARMGYYDESMRIYQECASDNPTLAPIYLFNYDLAKNRQSDLNTKIKRVAIYASYSNANKIEDYVIYYLSKLKEDTDLIVYVCDNPLADEEVQKINNVADIVITGRHGEYDFGSYKRGYLYLLEKKLLGEFEELVFCNDSCYGPIESFERIFKVMQRRRLDFWGLTQNSQFSDHLQSYFLVFGKAVFQSAVFREFIIGVTKEKSVQMVINKYEVNLTKTLSENGFLWGSFVDTNDEFVLKKTKINSNLTVFPSFLVKEGGELIKVKSLRYASANLEGIKNTIEYIAQRNNHLLDLIRKHSNIDHFESFSGGFSIVIATYNRSATVVNSIMSVLQQETRSKYEIIIIDDCSTDSTKHTIYTHFINEIEAGTIKYHRNISNLGLSVSRNIGINMAKYEWIAYLDSDNRMRPHYISAFSDAIASNNDSLCFYAKYATMSDGIGRGIEFSREKLYNSNYIDSNTIVHHKSLIQKYGNYDPSLRRLVDWDFMLRLTSEKSPIFIPTIVVDYNDSNIDGGRISNKESFQKAQSYIIKKHKLRTKITTVIITYNHQNSLADAIESACIQKGNFDHEIYVVDDCSTDKTWDVIAKYSKKHPRLIKGFRQESNVGQSLNIKQALTFGEGRFISILEGDDYWVDPYKIQQQSDFLDANYDCSMVFSKIKVKNNLTQEERLLKRQNNLGDKLTGKDFLAHQGMNLICNFSSCMYRKELVSIIPDFLFAERFNEVALAFFMENYGLIGFIDKVMSVYVQHGNGLWSGIPKHKQDQLWIDARKLMLKVAKPMWLDEIQYAIDSRT